jgi:hypothetical protein
MDLEADVMRAFEHIGDELQRVDGDDDDGEPFQGVLKFKLNTCPAVDVFQQTLVLLGEERCGGSAPPAPAGASESR